MCLACPYSPQYNHHSHKDSYYQDQSKYGSHHSPCYAPSIDSISSCVSTIRIMNLCVHILRLRPHRLIFVSNTHSLYGWKWLDIDCMQCLTVIYPLKLTSKALYSVCQLLFRFLMGHINYYIITIQVPYWVIIIMTSRLACHTNIMQLRHECMLTCM